MRGISVPFACFLALLALAIPAAVQAQEDPLLTEILGDVAAIDSKIAGWERKADILLAVVLSVGMLGLVITAIQSLSKPWGKTVTFFIGLLVSALTFVHQQIFPADRGTYQAVALDARKLAREVREDLRLVRLDQTIANDVTKKLDFIRGNITPKLNTIYDLEKKLLVKGSVAADSTGAAVTGAGECNTSWQAQQNSQVAAVEQLVQSLKKARPGPWSPSESGILRQYVTSYTNTSGRRFTFDETSRMFRYFTEMRFHPVFAKDQLVLDYLRQQQQQQKGAPQPSPSLSKRAPRSSPTGNRVEGVLRLPSNFSGAQPVVPVLARNPRDGKFGFRFTVTRPQGQLARVSLDEIEVFEDGSVGSTPWAFEIHVDGKYAFELPMQRWDDSQKPTRCRFGAPLGFSATAAATGKGLEVKVVGYKPKDQ